MGINWYLILIHLGKYLENDLETATAAHSLWCITTVTQLWHWILVQDEMFLNRNGFQDICAGLSGCKQCTLLGNVLFHSMWCSLYILNTPCKQLPTKAMWRILEGRILVSVGPTLITKTEESRCRKKCYRGCTHLNRDFQDSGNSLVNVQDLQ